MKKREFSKTPQHKPDLFMERWIDRLNPRKLSRVWLMLILLWSRASSKQLTLDKFSSHWFEAYVSTRGGIAYKRKKKYFRHLSAVHDTISCMFYEETGQARVVSFTYDGLVALIYTRPTQGWQWYRLSEDAFGCTVCPKRLASTRMCGALSGRMSRTAYLGKENLPWKIAVASYQLQ